MHIFNRGEFYPMIHLVPEALSEHEMCAAILLYDFLVLIDGRLSPAIQVDMCTMKHRCLLSSHAVQK